MTRSLHAIDRRSTAASQKWWLAAATLLVATVALACFYGHFRVDPRLAEVRKLQAESLQAMFADSDQQPEPVRRQATYIALQEKMKTLSEAERQQAQYEMRQMFIVQVRRQEEKRLSEFFALPEGAERIAYIDACIENDEGRPHVGSSSAASQGTADVGTSGSDRSGTGPPRGSWATLSPDERKQRARQRLDSTTPKYRALRAEFRRLVQERRQELGLPPDAPRTFLGLGGVAPVPASPASSKSAPTPRS
ncbi:MAG: hypothetical protein K8T25_20810 [Planctomycetia bacterium]|nr:hypothetical protein [Planctomycetia bacterium]